MKNLIVTDWYERRNEWAYKEVSPSIAFHYIMHYKYTTTMAGGVMGKFTIKINKNPFNAIIKGVGQIMDVKGSYSYSLRKKYLEKPGYELDCQSIKTDWETVGHDIKKAMEQY